MKYTEKQVNKLLKGIYEGSIDANALPEDLYIGIANYLRKGLYQGYGKTLKQAKGRDLTVVTELRENIYMFSGAKTYQEVELMRDFAAEAKGYKEFKEATMSIFDKYNGTWLKTEYDTCIGQAQCAAKWQQFEEEKDVLPNLRYSTIGDACPICQPLNGLTLPVGHHKWKKVAPLNHFHCFCLLEATDAAVKDMDIKPVLANMDDVFMMNPGTDGYIFSPKHPYFTVKAKDKELAKQNFNLPIPTKD